MTQPNSPPSAAETEKAALRKTALAARAALTEADRRDAALAVAMAGAEIVSREKPARVSLFVSIRGEIGTQQLAARLADMGVPLCLPVIIKKGQPLTFREWKPGDELVKKPFGLMEPPESAAEVVPDLLFVPLAAFDPEGRRLGYGGGFYDRTLAKLRAEGPAAAIGLAFAAQELPQVPTLDYDEPLDGVLTEKGYRPVTGLPG